MEDRGNENNDYNNRNTIYCLFVDKFKAKRNKLQISIVEMRTMITTIVTQFIYCLLINLKQKEINYRFRT